ncbi:8-amino-7-oxononanoate synthase family protein [Mycobacterium spongiae]|uniref:8-amino-7-oxononanoate synthase n=1 Tax=Mycobacterium spongiae TaxID=886343 RepID=A0A975K1A3_9MYCO|nr:8-amino-7-oxononanoate synthase family protein [Mycobacterium spongiae]QUR68303.1 aminotransferase class I/II-fold pyridoxal phosphate-dependent enzyme [Mycobacterium spongiae]
MPTGLSYDCLSPAEESRINDMNHYYVMVDSVDGEALGRANIYSVNFDLATTDRKLTPDWRTTIKRWFPGFMKFRFLECGMLTMTGNPLALRSDTSLERVLPVVADQMVQLAQADESDFLMIRDVEPEHYHRYLDILRPFGFLPALGFSRVTTNITWPCLHDALGSMRHKKRNQLANSLRFHERFGIELEELDEYAEHAAVLARLWRNVMRVAKDYQREDLNPEFFAACSRHMRGRSKLFLFRYHGTPVAFILNMWDTDENYVVLEWGVDPTFEHYRQANLYRAALVLSLNHAITLGKRRMEMGVTTYFPKLSIPGALVIPTIYFLRHRTDPVHTTTLARMMMHNIQRPSLPKEMSEQFCRWEERIRLDQDGLSEHDIFRKIDRQHKYTGLKLGGVYGFYPQFTGPQRSTIPVAQLGEIVLLGTNSYLGLATHPEVVAASTDATRRYGTGCSGSPLLNGTLDLHVALEEELAAFLSKPAAVVCSTGYQSNLAAISALCESGDMIIQDALNHRSLFDAARLSGADFTVYRHNDMDHLARVLTRTEGRRRIIVVDAVFSMEGTIADLATITELAARHGCRVYVDESHAMGVLGPNGNGAAGALGVLSSVDLVMGTFSKSFASIGGFIAGERPVIDYIRHNGAGHVFSASLPPAAVAATHAALHVSLREPDRRTRVLASASYAATGMARLGYQAEYHGTPIVPVVLGNPTLAHAGYLRLMRSGVYVNPVAPPAVPEERSGFRTSYIAEHQQRDLDRALDVFADLAEDLIPQGATL